MAISTSKPAGIQTALLFGPQFLSFTAESLAQLRNRCQESPGLQEWVLQTFAELRRHWISVTAAFPSLERLAGEQQLEDVLECIRNGNPPRTPFPFPNLLLCPLVVVLQLIQYMQYREIFQPRNGQGWLPEAGAESVEVVGFCTGLLSAFAVSCSRSREQLSDYGANAVRLAMLVGAVTDSRDVTGTKSNSLSAAWQSQDGKAKLHHIINTFPEVRTIMSDSA